jgi:hypothetical protein
MANGGVVQEVRVQLWRRFTNTVDSKSARMIIERGRIKEICK